MSKHLIYVICLSILILGNCAPNEKSTSREPRMQILYETIPTLFDSVFIDITKTPPPPPPSLKMTKKDSLRYKKIYDDYLAEKEQHSDTVLLAIHDSIIKIDNPERLLDQHFNVPTRIVWDSTEAYASKIDINKISLPKRFILRSVSAFPKGRKIWNGVYDYELAGVFFISNVEFDITRTYGIVKWGFVCGPLCGHGGYAFIVNKNGKWIIDQISTNWVS